MESDRRLLLCRILVNLGWAALLTAFVLWLILRT
jgi:hypothetical protein